MHDSAALRPWGVAPHNLGPELLPLPLLRTAPVKDHPKRLTLARQEPEQLSVSRAGLIARIWQGIEFIELIRADLRTSPQKDPVAITLTAATNQMLLAASLLGPKSAQPAPPRVEHEPAEPGMVPSIRVRERRGTGTGA